MDVTAAPTAERREVAYGSAGTLSTSKRGSALIRYDKCNHYDRHRRPIGMRRMARWIRERAVNLSLPLARMRGASLCCGTGQNERRLLELIEGDNARLDRLLLCDASDGMLDALRPKLEPFTTRWEAQKLDVVRDEIEDGLHFAACIQATQHLDRNGEGYPQVRRLFGKVRRSLVLGGSFFLIISTPKQVLDGHWFINVMTNRADVPPEQDPGRHFASEHANLSTVISLLEEANLSVARLRALEGPHFLRESYFGAAQIAQDPEFRHSSSFFSIAEGRGLIGRYDEVLSELIESGEIDEHRERSEHARKQNGVSFLIEATAA